MSENRRRRPANYLVNDDATVIGAKQKTTAPRPGCGTIYVHLGHADASDHPVVTVAEWVDEFPEPDADGASVGLETVEGHRSEVIAWVKARNPVTVLVFNFEQGEWIPMPSTDDEIDASLMLPTGPDRTARNRRRLSDM